MHPRHGAVRCGSARGKRDAWQHRLLPGRRVHRSGWVIAPRSYPIELFAWLRSKCSNRQAFAKLTDANPSVKPEALQVGHVINLPCASAPAPPVPPVQPTPSSGEPLSPNATCMRPWHLVCTQ